MAFNLHLSRDKLLIALAAIPEGQPLNYVHIADSLGLSEAERKDAMAQLVQSGFSSAPSMEVVELRPSGRQFAKILKDNARDADDASLLALSDVELQRVVEEYGDKHRTEKTRQRLANKALNQPASAPEIPAATASDLILKQLTEGEQLLAAGVTENAFNTWRITTDSVVNRALGRNSPEANEVTRQHYSRPVFLQPTEEKTRKKAFEELTAYIARLKSASNLLTIMAISDPKHPAIPNAPTSNRVFLVHGHDEAANQKAARCIEKLGLEVVILHEQADEGQTIIEKFEKHSDVHFAVVMMTADDVGGSKGTPLDKLKARPRQNVIFELGFFVGRLTRKHVCCLHKKDVEMLSDYSGVLYLPIDEGDGWKLKLGKEMKNAGLPADMNRL